MAAGIDLADFRTMFPEFSTVSDATVTTYINLINNGYQLVTNNVADTTVLNIYYWLCAHFVASGTQWLTGMTATPSGSYMLESTSAAAVSASFAKIQNLSADQSFMLSTRYGQVYWTMSKQQYIQNFYLNQGCGWF